MRLPALSLLATLLLAACATPLPPHDPGKAGIEIRGDPAIQLGADQLDGRRWADRRYFQVEPGEHRLQVRLGFEVTGGSGPDNRDGGGWRTCILEVCYAGFAAGAAPDQFAD